MKCLFSLYFVILGSLFYLVFLLRCFLSVKHNKQQSLHMLNTCISMLYLFNSTKQLPIIVIYIFKLINFDSIRTVLCCLSANTPANKWSSQNSKCQGMFPKIKFQICNQQYSKQESQCHTHPINETYFVTYCPKLLHYQICAISY